MCTFSEELKLLITTFSFAQKCGIGYAKITNCDACESEPAAAGEDWQNLVQLYWVRELLTIVKLGERSRGTGC